MLSPQQGFVEFIDNEALNENLPVPGIYIVAAASVVFGISEDDIRIPLGRRDSHVAARCIVSRLLRNQGRAYQKIGRFMGGADHATIINRVRHYEKRVVEDKEFAEQARIVEAVAREFFKQGYAKHRELLKKYAAERIERERVKAVREIEKRQTKEMEKRHTKNGTLLTAVERAQIQRWKARDGMDVVDALPLIKSHRAFEHAMFMAHNMRAQPIPIKQAA